ncbi:hypothetical protein D915_000645 [Fasciola hepatica]|uniref:Uncharacterized protein n=1 Tax=Fasciola hepatica TaxID=6192 RepID=A0A4E0RRD2_FASHE|nr:hypothetical protein D915_000645 [Fasciola hepatica]
MINVFGFSSPTIPTPSESSSARFEMCEDPELHFDLLPMPYRMLNNLLWELFDAAWQVITDRQRLLVTANGLLMNVQLSDSVLKVPTHLFIVINQLVVVCSENKVMLYEAGQGDQLVSECICDEQNIRTLAAYSITSSLLLVLTVDDLGKAYIIVVKHNRSRVVHSIVPDLEAKQFYVLTGKISPDGRICTFVIQDKETQTTWIELYTIPVESWIKETDSLAQATEQTEPSVRNWSLAKEITEDSATIDKLWNEVQLSTPTLYCKVKAPTRMTGSTVKSLTASLRQIPENCTPMFPLQLSRTGLHLFTEAALEHMRGEFIRYRDYPRCLLRSPKQEPTHGAKSERADPVASDPSVQNVPKPSADAVEAQTKPKGPSSKQSKRKEAGESKANKQNNPKKIKGSKLQPVILKHQEDDREPVSIISVADSNAAEHERLNSTQDKFPQPEQADSTVDSQRTGNENESEKDIARLLVEFDSFRDSSVYPRYEFIPYVEIVEDGRPSKIGSNSGKPHSLCAYWTNDPCLYFYCMEKPNKNLELTLEDARIFSSAINHIKVLQCSVTGNETPLQQRPSSRSTSRSSSSFENRSPFGDDRSNKILLLIGLFNGSVIIRDMDTGLYWPTVTTWDAPICQLGIIRHPAGGFQMFLSSIVHSASNVLGAPKFRLSVLHLDEHYDVNGQSTNPVSVGNGLYRSACIHQPDSDNGVSLI